MYTITITKVEENILVPSRDYRKLTDIESEGQYGYVDAELYKDKSTEIYSQSVEDLNIVRVIQAVNAGE